MQIKYWISNMYLISKRFLALFQCVDIYKITYDMTCGNEYICYGCRLHGRKCQLCVAQVQPIKIITYYVNQMIFLVTYTLCCRLEIKCKLVRIRKKLKIFFQERSLDVFVGPGTNNLLKSLLIKYYLKVWHWTFLELWMYIAAESSKEKKSEEDHT